MPEVRVVDLSKSFGKITALEGVNLNIHDHEYFSLLGPSGCGKTTLLRIIAGLIRPDKGEIYIGDKLVNDVPPEDRDIGFVFQTFALFPHMNTWDNVTYGPKVKGFDARKAKTIGDEVLEMVKLHERLDAFPSELSGGMMQRIAVARALAAGAKLLLLDEPLGQLDAKVRTELRYDMRKMTKDLGLTAVHVTHDQAEAMAISDRIALMRKGKIVQVGPPSELYLHPENIFAAHFIGESNFFEGYIVKGSNDGVGLIELRGGISVEVLETKYAVGERVVLAIRPEAFAVKKGLCKERNSILGVIEKITFEGTNMRYEVRLQNEDLIVLIRSSLGEEWFNMGEKVSVAFLPERAHVFECPPGGLKEEMMVE